MDNMDKKNVLTAVAIIAVACLIVGGFILGLPFIKSLVNKPVQVAVVEAPVEVEEKEEVVEEEPEPQPRRRQRRDINSSINRVVPMQGDQIQGMPTREEAVNAAWDILTAYREATPQEKQQMAMTMNVAQYVINGIAQNADQFIQRMTPEQRDQLMNSSAASFELLNAVQEEMIGNVSDEEAMVFGGVFQSLQNLNESLMEATIF